MRELALFAGIGGGILGGKLLGWRTVCAVERDEYASAVLCARQNEGLLPPFPIWDNIETFRGEYVPEGVDVVSGGFPCQDISSSGRGAGIDGERSGLWSEMFRIIGEVRPPLVFAENSPLLVQRGLERVLKNLDSLGYYAEWGVLGADAVGLPHRRARLWLVAYDASRRSYARHLLEESGIWQAPGQPGGLPGISLDVRRRRAYQGDVCVSIFRVPSDGVPPEVGELRGYGNAQVPAVAATAFRVLSWMLLGDEEGGMQ